MSGGGWQKRLILGAQRLAERFGGRRAAHLELGSAGELAAYFHLRELGYVMVARNWRTRGRKGEIDLIGWDQDELCFIEVKSRSERGLVAAELAVDRDKQRELRAMAQQWLRRFPAHPRTRFDVVSVYMIPDQKPVIEVYKGAFGWRTMNAR